MKKQRREISMNEIKLIFLTSQAPAEGKQNPYELCISIDTQGKQNLCESCISICTS